MLSPVQTDTTLLGFYTLRPFAHASVCACVRLYTLLHVVGSCCAKFQTGQTFSHVQTNATTPSFVGPTMLGVVESVCS